MVLHGDVEEVGAPAGGEEDGRGAVLAGVFDEVGEGAFEEIAVGKDGQGGVARFFDFELQGEAGGLGMAAGAVEDLFEQGAQGKLGGVSR